MIHVGVVKNMFPNYRRSGIFRRLILSLKEDRNGGRKDRRIEFSEGFCGRGMEETQGDTVNTKVRSNQRVTKFFFKNNMPYVLLQVSIYRILRWRKIGRGRVALTFRV